MSINAQSVTESFVKRLTVITSQSAVECRFSGSDGANDILAVCPQVVLASCEVSSGRVNYGGRLICTAVSCGTGGTLSRIQKGAEFTHYADNDLLAPAQTAICALSCERASVRRDGSSFVVTVIISARISVYGNAERSYISSAEGAVCRTQAVNMCSAVTFSGSGEVEDDFDAAGISDILMHDAKVLTYGCRCGAGEIQINGDVYLSMLALRDGEPVALDRVIPFSSEIVCDNAVFARKADCLTALSGTAVTAQVDEDCGRCSIRFTAQLAFAGSFTEDRKVQAVTDAFCTDSETETETFCELTPVCEDIKLYTERVGGSCAAGAKIDYGCSFKAVASPKAECTYSAETGMLEGAVTSVLIYSKDGETHSTDVTLPFSVKLNGLGGDARIDVAVIGVSVRQRSEGQCEGEATLKIAAADYAVKECVCVSDISRTCDAPCPAVTVLVPAAGDTLWDIAKKLKRKPQDITDACPNLTFPLNGGERVVIYRSKNT
ncbi:MAG: DUF3794 domain-containing protein [Clostridia bacterium]|nr:DUF3794 domain-containing protein [Clostridia bacterium]